MTHHLMGTSEIAELLGVSRQRAAQLAASEGFPAPVVKLAAGPVWERQAVENWAVATGRMSVGEDGS
jgi:hypothetical protein